MHKPHPFVYSTLGATATVAMLFHAADHLGRGVIVCGLLFALVRYNGRWQYFVASALGAAVTWIVIRFLTGGPEVLLALLFVGGVVLGTVAGFWFAASDLPGFRFFREDFLEFCGSVGLISAFPAIFTIGIGAAADVAGRLAFELAFLGACALAPLLVVSHAIAGVRSLRTKRNAAQLNTASPARDPQ
jgi:hypothetical protein